MRTSIAKLATCHYSPSRHASVVPLLHQVRPFPSILTHTRFTDHVNSDEPADPSRDDIVTESLSLFRANSLFRNFEIKGSADRTLIYLILFIGDCLSKISTAKAPGWNAKEAEKQLASYAMEAFSLPGEPGFPLNSLYQPPQGRMDAGPFPFLRWSTGS